MKGRPSLLGEKLEKVTTNVADLRGMKLVSSIQPGTYFAEAHFTEGQSFSACGKVIAVKGTASRRERQIPTEGHGFSRAGMCRK
jgi:hypothetical protein